MEIIPLSVKELCCNCSGGALPQSPQSFRNGWDSKGCVFKVVLPGRSRTDLHTLHPNSPFNYSSLIPMKPLTERQCTVARHKIQTPKRSEI